MVPTHSRRDGNSGSFIFFSSKHIKLSIRIILSGIVSIGNPDPVNPGGSVA